jgi:hypothetical protein
MKGEFLTPLELTCPCKYGKNQPKPPRNAVPRLRKSEFLVAVTVKHRITRLRHILAAQKHFLHRNHQNLWTQQSPKKCSSG